MVAIDDEPHGLEFLVQATAAYTVLVNTLDDRRALRALIEFLLFVRCHFSSIPLFDHCKQQSKPFRKREIPMCQTQRKDEIDFFLKKNSTKKVICHFRRCKLCTFFHNAKIIFHNWSQICKRCDVIMTLKIRPASIKAANRCRNFLDCCFIQHRIERQHKATLE